MRRRTARHIDWKTETIGSYVSRQVPNTDRAARRFLVAGENKLQQTIRAKTPTHTTKLRGSIASEHKGRWESVGAGSLDSSSIGVRTGVFETIRGGAKIRGANRIWWAHQGYNVMPRELHGSVYTNVEYAPHVEYDTGIYNKRRGRLRKDRRIRPVTKKALAFTTKSGKAVVVASVKGYKGRHMFSRSVAQLNRSRFSIPNSGKKALSQWRAYGEYVRPFG